MPATPITTILGKNQHLFHPVVRFDPGNDKLLSLDLTRENTELTADIFSDTGKFTRFVNEKIENAGARYAIGGFAEHRKVYSMSIVFDGAQPGEEPRRLHLGTDIWGKPHTAVMCPLDGIVHSFAFNNRMGDYGATIILSHFLEGMSFYTLYGHLGLSSIKNIREGDRIEKGDLFAEFGIPAENGQWPPHLHFQLVKDIKGYQGDYPGVCKFSEKENWLANSPDPDYILQLNKYLVR